MAVIESRVWRLAIAGVAVWTLACGGGGSEPVTRVASVTVSPSAVSMGIGDTKQLTATLLDASGAPLSARPVSWTTSNAGIATVSASGFVTAVAGGAATITATSDGKSGTAVLSITMAPPTNVILTGILNAATFVNLCPTSDTAYATLAHDFQFLSEGQPNTVPVVCTDPYPTTHLTDEVLNYQTLRMVYYMAQGTEGKLPWTPLSLYDWMKSQIAGVDFHVSAAVSSCCEIINGKKYISLARKDSSMLSGYRDWFSVANWLALLAHETRHAAGYPHVNGCPAFPLPTDPAGCDPTYDLGNLGAYGIQYWLFANWASGYLNVGIACNPPTDAHAMTVAAADAANVYPPRFVQNAPPNVTASDHGGDCYIHR